MGNQAPFTFSRQFLASCSCQHVAWTLPFAQHVERRRHLSSVASQKTSREAFDLLHNIFNLRRHTTLKFSFSFFLHLFSFSMVDIFVLFLEYNRISSYFVLYLESLVV